MQIGLVHVHFTLLQWLEMVNSTEIIGSTMLVLPKLCRKLPGHVPTLQQLARADRMGRSRSGHEASRQQLLL